MDTVHRLNRGNHPDGSLQIGWLIWNVSFLSGIEAKPSTFVINSSDSLPVFGCPSAVSFYPRKSVVGTMQIQARALLLIFCLGIVSTDVVAENQPESVFGTWISPREADHLAVAFIRPEGITLNFVTIPGSRLQKIEGSIEAVRDGLIFLEDGGSGIPYRISAESGKELLRLLVPDAAAGDSYPQAQFELILERWLPSEMPFDPDDTDTTGEERSGGFEGEDEPEVPQ